MNIKSKAIKGFTLIELIIVIVILGIISALGSQILSAIFSAYNNNKAATEIAAQQRLALQIITRHIALIPASIDLLTNSTAADLNFFELLPSDAAYVRTTDTSSKVSRITNSSGNVMLSAGAYSASLSPLLKNATVSFGYLTNTGAAINIGSGSLTAAQVATVHYIAITLTVNSNNINQTLKTIIFMRNF